MSDKKLPEEKDPKSPEVDTSQESVTPTNSSEETVGEEVTEEPVYPGRFSRSVDSDPQDGLPLRSAQNDPGDGQNEADEAF